MSGIAVYGDCHGKGVMNMIRKICALCLTVLMTFSTAGPVFAENGAGTDTAVTEIHVSVYGAICGQDPRENPPEPFLDEEDTVQLTEPTLWTTGSVPEDLSLLVPLQEAIVGDQEYTAVVTVEARPGYRFSRDTRVLVYDYENGKEEDDYCIQYEPLRQDSHQLTIAVARRADHNWDWTDDDKTPATCRSKGEIRKVCRGNPSHRITEETDVDPDAHVWGEWTIIKEASKAEEGEQYHVCELCGAEETEVIPVVTEPYTKVYEPQTSWPMAATIAWRADSRALEAAGAAVRPATAFVWLDAGLKVYDRDGGLLAENVEDYVKATAAGVIPAFYIRDAETASALKKWLTEYRLQDCFVISTPENKALVKDVADLLHVRGMLDYTEVRNPDRKALTQMVADVNGSHGKVILLSAEAATRDNVRLLQSLASTVWVQTPADLKSLMTMYTNGVNGIVTDDYEAAIRAEERFQDDAPSLLRPPLIIGHRGDPSVYVENTLDSARGAYEEGVDSVENDIQLSADGELFILHDESPYRLLGIRDVENAEEMTLEQLRNHPFLWDDIISMNEVPASVSRYGTLYGQKEQKAYTVPTLREYIEEFKGNGLVHDTEIKSLNPAIIPVFKALVDEYDAWDQFFCITFNETILDALYAGYPEISAGVLCFAAKGAPLSYMVGMDNYQSITETEGAEAALQSLYGTIDRWNATYNPYNQQYGEEMVRAGRHRGLTVWPWTYYHDAVFARDYLSGVTGMTTDYPWVASDYVVEISSEDVTVISEAEIPKPHGTTQAGAQKILHDAELVELEKLSGSQTLMIWRYPTELDVNGEKHGNYYLYSNPFVVRKSSGSSGSGVASAYPVILPSVSSGGSTESSVSRAKAGEKVTITVRPEEDYQTMALRVTDADGHPVEVTDNADGTYTLTMPAGSVTVEPVFVKKDDSSEVVCLRDDSCPMTPFADADRQAWYHDGVHWAIEKGIMNGTGPKSFAPLLPASRAMITVMLWRLEGSPRTGGHAAFRDVPEGMWYTEAVRWAAGSSLVTGYSEERFGPDDAITREQLATILYRHARWEGLVEEKLTVSSLLDYEDAGQISNWAMEAMRWAVGSQMIRGRAQSELVPAGSATRAEIATMFMRYSKTAVI